VTALHKDNYENVYVQIAGQKHFVLLPPVCHACVGETQLKPAHYQRRPGPGDARVLGPPQGQGEDEEEDRGGDDGKAGGRRNPLAGGSGLLELVVEEGEEEVPFAVWDPDTPGENSTRYSALAQPMRVTLNPGDMLYLPCMWWVLTGPAVIFKRLERKG
jgi:jumonji domain-containing protein 7